MAIQYPREYKKNYVSRVDQIIDGNASNKTRNNILIQKDKMSKDSNFNKDYYSKKSISLVSYNY